MQRDGAPREGPRVHGRAVISVDPPRSDAGMHPDRISNRAVSLFFSWLRTQDDAGCQDARARSVGARALDAAATPDRRRFPAQP